MSKNTVKLIIFVGALALLIPGSLIGFRTLSDFIAAFNSGADPASIFRGHQLAVPEREEARWLSFDAEGSAPKQVEREELISAYWLAWESLVRAHETGDPADLPTYWAGPALDAARSAIAGGQTIFTHDGHRLRLLFFSDDSSVALLRDENFHYTQTIAGTPVTLTATAEVVMTLDNGFWRIRQYILDFSST
ncbi:MAG: hypothetical protein IPK19_05100 [Chloroflexi bacterium]|nr:hypothetical protein [Chloroflexota bacterium]